MTQTARIHQHLRLQFNYITFYKGLSNSLVDGFSSGLMEEAKGVSDLLVDVLDGHESQLVVNLGFGVAVKGGDGADGHADLLSNAVTGGLDEVRMALEALGVPLSPACALLSQE